MSVLTTVKELLGADADSSTRADSTGERSKGSYWCHDCGQRIRDVAVDGDATPDCPECGDEMAFERSPDSAGCAC